MKGLLVCLVLLPLFLSGCPGSTKPDMPEGGVIVPTRPGDITLCGKNYELNPELCPKHY